MPKTKKMWWERLSDEKLLDLRFCDLELEISGSRVENCIHQLYQELRQKRIRFRPHFWIAEEWFAHDGVPGIAVPFYVIHERLGKLEKRMLLEAEGFTPVECMKLLRHEAGHAIDNAFHLRKSKKRQTLFGFSSTAYPTSYSPKAYSKKYVIHLNSWYAQAHPDEDWAETFAVWLNPKSNWRTRYKNWPAIDKLKMVNEIMLEIKGVDPLVFRQDTPSNISKSRKKLKTYYKEKRESMALDRPFTMGPLIRKLFSDDKKYKKRKMAFKFILEEKKLISKKVAKWTGQYQYTVDLMLLDLIRFSKEKKLRLMYSEKETRMDLVGMLTAQTANYISSGNHKIPL